MYLGYYLIFLIKAASSLSPGQQYVFQSESALVNVMCSAEKVQFITKSVSAISCVKVCSLGPDCHAAIFYHRNKTCFGLNTDDPFNVTISLPGTVFYKPVMPNPPTTTTALTTAASTSTTVPAKSPSMGCESPLQMVATVSDSQISSSSDLSSTYLSYKARLDNTAGYWVAQLFQVGEYIKVDFLSLRLATAVITQGCGVFNEWVTSYTVSISIDCVTFTAILNSNGAEQIFPGYTDKDAHVTNNLDPPVSVRCLRIYVQ